MKIAVIGSRSFANFELLQDELQQLFPSQIITGGARGADSLAIKFAKLNKIPIKVFRPDYKKYGRTAPLLRNIDIICEADFVLAFWDSKSSGTLNALQKAKRFRKLFKVVKFKTNV